MLSTDAAWPLVSEYHHDYKVLRQIASGAFGSVHCVQRRDTKVILAAKYVKSAEEDFKREVEALVSLRKSNLILQFVEFYASEPPKLCQSVLVTEFLAGGDLIERTSASVSTFPIVRFCNSHCSKSSFFVQKFNFDRTPTFSRVFHPFF